MQLNIFQTVKNALRNFLGNSIFQHLDFCPFVVFGIQFMKKG